MRQLGYEKHRIPVTGQERFATMMFWLVLLHVCVLLERTNIRQY